MKTSQCYLTYSNPKKQFIIIHKYKNNNLFSFFLKKRVSLKN